ncbi:hypothetical protein TNCV_2056741 [Trichonephila clavipes]|nr:hypothetical protein TNCV_2056741 [Trichonephila clavipes]
MEDEQIFQLYLAKYQGSDRGDFINFMMYFRLFLNTAKPKEVITIQNAYAEDNIDRMILVPHDQEPHDVPWYECFSYIEPVDLHRQVVKGEGAFIQLIWTVHAKPKFMVWPIKLGDEMVSKTWRAGRN